MICSKSTFNFLQNDRAWLFMQKKNLTICHVSFVLSFRFGRRVVVEKVKTFSIIEQNLPKINFYKAINLLHQKVGAAVYERTI